MNLGHRYKTSDVITRDLCRKVYGDFSDALFVTDKESSSRLTRKFYATVMADLVSFVEDATKVRRFHFCHILRDPAGLDTTLLHLLNAISIGFLSLSQQLECFRVNIVTASISKHSMTLGLAYTFMT